MTEFAVEFTNTKAMNWAMEGRLADLPLSDYHDPNLINSTG